MNDLNLWALYPEVLFDVPYIFQLQYLSACLFLTLIIPFIIHPSERASLSLFMGLSLATSTALILTLGPGMSDVFLPLLLIMGALYPLTKLVILLQQGSSTQTPKTISVWLIASLAGITHLLAWGTWVTALAGS